MQAYETLGIVFAQIRNASDKGTRFLIESEMLLTKSGKTFNQTARVVIARVVSARVTVVHAIIARVILGDIFSHLCDETLLQFINLEISYEIRTKF